MESSAGYSQIKMRDDYRKEYSAQRRKNLIHLRSDIAKMNLSDFANNIGIVKSNLSEIEDGKRDLSIGNIHSYRTFFKEKYNLTVSIDYLLGYTDVIINQIADIASDFGLSNDSIEVLRNMSATEIDMFNKLAAENGMLNLLLSELWIYAHNSSFVNIKITNHITDSVENITDLEEIDSIMKARVIDTFSSIIIPYVKRVYRKSVSNAANNKIELLKAKSELLSLEKQQIKDGD
ncbi:MAG: hypothetical protein ACLTPC_01475 [Lacrimispora saccharolytica]